MRCTRCLTMMIFVALVVAVVGFISSADAATLTWQDNSGNEQNFNVERKTGACAGAGTWAEIAQVAANITTYRDAAVMEGQTYCWRVAASNAAGKSAYSNTAELLIPFTIPAAPGQLGAIP